MSNEEREFQRGYSAVEKPVKQGEEYDVKIETVGTRGDGVAKISNFVIFVPGTVAGENTRVKITAVHAKFALAEKV